MKRSSGWCVSEGFKCGGGLPGRKCVSVAEVCSAAGDHEARGGRTSAEAMMNGNSSVHSKQSKSWKWLR